VFVVKKYDIDGKRFRFLLPGPLQAKQLAACQQRTRAHQANGNQVGVFEELAEQWAIMLTPEGMDPDTKDRERVKAEILALPLKFFIQAMRDLEEHTERLRRGISAPPETKTTMIGA
jgi:hypothetical protein